MAVTVSDRLLTVGRGRDRDGLMPTIASRDRDWQSGQPSVRDSRRYKRGPAVPNCIVLCLNSGMQFKRTCTTDV